jgi:oligopeptide/dipeptide ABC transporter ATP-binding protein
VSVLEASKNLMDQILLEIINLKKAFSARAGFLSNDRNKFIRAVDGVSLQVRKGETLGLIGESGCGKSTLARLILHLEIPTEGTVTFENNDIFQLKGVQLKEYRRNVQMIFQDPYSSLNPRMTAGEIIAEPLKVHRLFNKDQRRNSLVEIAALVGLNEGHLKRYPHEFSGGQRQRIGIARALILKPRLVVADEPVSSLDLSVQAQILNLMKHLQNELELTSLFITHDFGVVRHMSDRIAVMYQGKVVELGETTEICRAPVHPYTQVLLRAVPELDPEKKRRSAISNGPEFIEGYSGGCAFFPRCLLRRDVCKAQEPVLEEYSQGHWVACHNNEKKSLHSEKNGVNGTAPPGA